MKKRKLMSSSKLYIYNPTCDMAVENGTNSYMASANLRTFESDISDLMAFLGSETDYIKSDRYSSKLLKKFWEDLNFSFPKIIHPNDDPLSNQETELYPWGWSQLIVKNYHNIKDKNQYWPNFSISSTKLLFSRITSYKLAMQTSKCNIDNNFIHKINIPQKITNLEEVEKMLLNHPQGLVLKTLWSSSGRGLVFIRTKKELSANKKWLNSKVKQHEFMLAETLHDKVQDASLQFIINKKGEYEFLGINYFDADSSGKFSKEYFHTPIKIKKLLPKDDYWIDDTAKYLISSMKAINLHSKYQGPIGIDALFVKTSSGELKFYPFIEANLRCNMGLINLALKKRAHPEAQGTWHIETFKPGKALSFFKRQFVNNPIVLKDGLIRQGFLPLSSFDENQHFAAWGLIS